MTKIQKQVYDFIKAFWAEHGFSPSYSEIATHLGGTSKSNIHRLVTALSDRGFIEYRYGRARSITITNRPIAPPA
jgi:repressor LexA